MLKTPSGIVATFSCVCGAQDEVLEPAPLTVDCWSCKRPLSMRRWACQYDPPPISARDVTPEERARL